MKKKKVPVEVPNAPVSEESPLERLAKEMKALNEEDPVCERRGDGRD
jgi:hypothetical protein